ncbi:MAG: biotin--[acetyl-CoA-carboxylase] ligase [Pseudomonadota bacterium]
MTCNRLSGSAIDYRHLALQSCGSTNDECMKAASVGDPGRLWVTTEVQTSGKGSRGRQWESQFGNLFASLLLVDPCKNDNLSELTFVAAVAVGRTLVACMGETTQADIRYKWPNDVLINGKKVSGILLETRHQENPYVVIGIGINCTHHPKNTSYPATSLLTEGISVAPEKIFKTLANQMADTITKWQRGANFDWVREAWLEKAGGLGETISVRLENRAPVVGKFENIDDKGFLLLRLAGGNLTKISVGDVFFREKHI